MSEEKEDHVRTFIEFLRVPIMFYKTIGNEIFEYRSTNRLKSLIFKAYFFISFFNLNVLLTQEIIYVVIAMSSLSTMLQATAAAPCVGFVLVGEFKQIAMTVNKEILHNHLDELERIFPATREKQTEFQLLRYEKKMTRAMTIFAFLCLGFIFTFLFYPLAKSFIQYYLLGYPEFERNFGFIVWYPYDPTQTRLIYGVNYMLIAYAAYVAAIEFLSADLLLMASVTQLCMHFNYISKQLESFRSAEGPRSEEQDVDFLKKLVIHHTKCLELSEDVNKIFSLSLLLNFLTASLTICFIGFQVTASTPEDIFKYFIFMLTSMAQVFVVCYYGDELITASTGVGSAAYNHNWIECSQKYKKMLIYFMMRSQKGASIRAPTFPPISFNTFMKIISMSYQFFALLRTTYNKK